MQSAVTDRRLEIPGIAEVVPGNGGLPKVRVTTPTASGEIYLHGAHITSWKPAEHQEAFFLSSKSRWENGQAIRGGIPVCFPWFGAKADDPKAPNHGFVRTKSWQLGSIAQNGHDVVVGLVTESDEATKKWWPADFRLVLRATFGKQLGLELTLTNTGKAPLQFEEALHAYFRVGNVETVRIRIPDALRYIDKTDSFREKTQFDDISISSETDRVYLHTREEIQVEDTELKRRIVINKQNSLNTVIWNPWSQKARALSDLGPDEWPQMLCVEPSNVAEASVHVAPGDQHTLSVQVRIVES
jgi:glucose-6-phosphate 1-epimerase